ncbi:TetR/AcrR family transcriptional regulator [Pseudocitrobacter sp. RIT415]|uniref:TetR family transcriptional regulator n=1 Tax=Pseudocitrobacter faecalis TaxID=1398493 RepID=A0ABX9G4J2_9ENTR|nr:MULTISPECIES: TetR/AcrR family transcriptional regulator [Pseudocitrobacter]RAU52053.1 TetR/AcrR family transcriptional regulator [Pseudocitrobacter sp. RIT 415]RBP14893.1 TetR family transcriptional regulator [Pseudocitrobacter faecalis]UYW74739.1 TetR/AcrR family transcriptional regulator [Pseudocitrobacter faecalis]GHD91160.1 TetR family transcriptional regulator [Pseudocitrobacter faecalis]
MTTETQSCAKKGRGRPKVFDREAALDKAMTLFWQHGYEATSLSDLVEATGAKAPTLYAEFVNKEGLFRAVLDHYIAHFAAKHEAKLCCDDKPVDEALKDYFTAVATCYTSKDTPAGCFMINTSAALAASSKEIAKTIKSRHAVQEQTLREFLQHRQEKGEIPAGKDVKELALFLSCVLQGMSISAREGASFDTLMQITRTTLGLWPHMLGE